ncbi:Spc98 family-domain-containing protein [Neohortaea acidophila]|uniref:Spindle pole body component n=1 Tax=Neohortaea acidophila TaxID=245834 RepID=A0A6A6PU85_9PEZI|nr:Spc98 family-domain-containing protein [Neohortaea acidophila]KAF2483326.1 Spc98 family-domain-containing protein [Neohortaea acidophila]
MTHATRNHELCQSLVRGITGLEKSHPNFKQISEQATKALRTTNHSRTNPFAVNSTLDGLVEKFGVLNKDGLADALQTRLTELPTESKWLPEMLSLLLLLSDRPAEKTNLEDLNNLIVPIEVQQELTWQEFLGDDALEEPEIWDDIERGYHSSGDEGSEDERDDTVSTAATSEPTEDLGALARLHLTPVDQTALRNVDETYAELNAISRDKSVPELAIIREVLSMLHGLPTWIFGTADPDGTVSVDSKLSLTQTSDPTLKDLLDVFRTIGSKLNYLRNWSQAEQSQHFVQTCQVAAMELVATFEESLTTLEKIYVSANAATIVSLLDVRREVERLARSAMRLSDIIRASTLPTNSSPFALLDLLLEEANVAQMAGDTVLFQSLSDVLLPSLTTYLKPLSTWIRTGVLLDPDRRSFMGESEAAEGIETAWYSRYTMRTFPDGTPYAPAFMQELSGRVFATGRSQALLSASNGGYDGTATQTYVKPKWRFKDEQLHQNYTIPFIQGLTASLEEWIDGNGGDCMPTLCKSLLFNHGVLQTLDSLNRVFCSADGAAFQAFAEALFWRIDQGLRWRDGFLITELVQSTLGLHEVDLVATLDDDSRETTVPTSSITSLSCINLDISFPWPMQSITQSTSPATWSKTLALLLQVYRAKCLLRGQLLDLRARPSHATPGLTSILYALQLRYLLMSTVDILHAHVTTTASQLCAKLRAALENAREVDEMADLWREHHKQMETSLLLAPGLRPIHDAVMDILVLCEHFTVIWDGVVDGSQAKGTPNAQESTVVLSNLRTSAQKSLSFVSAGLRSVSRAGGDSALEALAERLQWIQ